MRRFSVKRKNPIRVYVQVFLVVGILIAAYFSFDQALVHNRSQEKQVVDKAVARCITQCYAQEGLYPPNIDYLTQQYGLTYNQKRFFIDYEYIGGNLRPQVTIIERN